MLSYYESMLFSEFLAISGITLDEDHITELAAFIMTVAHVFAMMTACILLIHPWGFIKNPTVLFSIYV